MSSLSKKGEFGRKQEQKEFVCPFRMLAKWWER